MTERSFYRYRELVQQRASAKCGESLTHQRNRLGRDVLNMLVCYAISALFISLMFGAKSSVVMLSLLALCLMFFLFMGTWNLFEVQSGVRLLFENRGRTCTPEEERVLAQTIGRLAEAVHNREQMHYMALSRFLVYEQLRDSAQAARHPMEEQIQGMISELRRQVDEEKRALEGFLSANKDPSTEEVHAWVTRVRARKDLSELGARLEELLDADLDKQKNAWNRINSYKLEDPKIGDLISLMSPGLTTA